MIGEDGTHRDRPAKGRIHCEKHWLRLAMNPFGDDLLGQSHGRRADNGFQVPCSWLTTNPGKSDIGSLNGAIDANYQVLHIIPSFGD